MLPNFLCIGAAKSGTTTLYEVLKQHSNIYLSSFKEPHFFDDNERFKKGIEWYHHTYFSSIKKEKLVGEFTPTYLSNPASAKRIKSCLDADVKLVVLLRNPIDRAYSHFLHTKRDQYEDLCFLDALEKESERLRLAKNSENFLSNLRYAYVEQGKYFKHIKRYLQHFKRGQVHIVIFEEFIKNPKEEVEKILYFLGLEKQPLNVSIQSNRASKPRLVALKNIMREGSIIAGVAKKMIPFNAARQKIRNYLHAINNKSIRKDPLAQEDRVICYQKYFLKEVQELEELLSIDLNIWKEC